MFMYTKYERPAKMPEKNSGEIITEQNYLNTNQQINSMIRAGERLVMARQEEFDMLNGEEKFETFPTRDADFDMADASQMMLALEGKYKEEPEKEKIAESDEPVPEEKPTE
ncbi:MAG: hypothetical protein EOM59_16600 [Clostridia bacterium]|nr:hypothetical protein [Clostridia bacterium]